MYKCTYRHMPYAHTHHTPHTNTLTERCPCPMPMTALDGMRAGMVAAVAAAPPPCVASPY
eukprot:scaffold4499_cov122-Isochrysis_galbana.AAC.3